MARALDLAGLRRFGFLTLADYSMIAVSNAIEALRMANRVSGEAIYEWSIVTPDQANVRASNALMLEPSQPAAAAAPFDVLFVCGGIDVRAATSAGLLVFLRQQARAGRAIGALCTGAFALAEAGLLRGYRCAVHWENLSGMREEFPEIDFSEDLFVIDRDRLTCAGGTAALDMMLKIVSARFGAVKTREIAAQFILERNRAGDETQPLALAGDTPTPLLRALRLIEHGIDRPLRIADIAAQAGLSVRQIERLFQRHIGCTPAAYLAGARLDRARRLLRQTAMAVTDIGIASGFVSAAHFSTAYRSRFGVSPREDRGTRPRISSGALPHALET